MRATKILATDLDRTLLPNGRWPKDPGAIELFNRLTEKHDVCVVYVTGRSLSLTEAAINEFAVRHPHVLISDVGTAIRQFNGDDWEADSGWDAHIRRMSPGWDAEAVRQALRGIDGLVEQEREHCGPFKQSYYVDHARRDAILETVDRCVKGHFDEVIIYSFDSESGDGLLDVLPQSATKQTALEYLSESLGVAKTEVVFCGDSGNDVYPLTAGFRGVLVRNADEQLVAGVKRALEDNSDVVVYFATGGCKGLNGYYTGGVIEGAYHYGVFQGDD
jgi:sucrose-6F-phosphate phosphohydrolase